jgi:predicted cupin superfamily sugar epimerase
MPKITAEEIIRLLALEPLVGEGGLYRQSYRSKDILLPSSLPARYTSAKPAGTAIYYLLTDEADSFSALHRLPTDEVYHFYLGDPVALTILLPEGDCQQVILGQDLLAGQHVQYLVPAGIWQGSKLLPGGSFALMGTTMAPGFTDDDFEAASRETFLADYPQHESVIRQLTREGEGDG